MKKFLLYTLVIATFVGCQNQSKESNEASSDNTDVMSDQLATADTVAISKIIKTADMRFRVKDVQQTKEQLSAVIKTQGGSVAEFNIQSIIQESDKVNYTLDSLKEITSYRKEGTMVAKIPSEKLDEFTNTTAGMAIFVHEQSLKMDDQSLAYLSNQMKLKNRKTALNSLSSQPQKKGTNVKTGLNIGDDAVDKKVENMAVDQQVKFSTITLSFYQANTVQSIVVPKDNLRDYGPGFFQRIGLNIASGWSFFKEIILGIINIWPLLIIAILIYLGFKFISNRRRQSAGLPTGR